MPRYGLIVEGIYDIPVFESLVRRLDGENVSFEPLVCEGYSNLMRRFPGLLKYLETAGVDKALVIRDCGRKSVEEVEKEMAARVADQRFSFPLGLELCAVRRETETWLLADEEAISTVALRRNGRRVGPINGELESIEDPKDRLRRALSEAKIEYLPVVGGEIAEIASIEFLKYRLPSFRRFVPKV